ncbi:MAG: MarR family transcriptional regulator [Phycisphaerae bacterium]|jgi:MarR family 2-MHQ and catechol resistance regulon transcriptional repressor
MNQPDDNVAKHLTQDDEMSYVHTGMGTELDTILVFNLLRTHNYLNPFIDLILRQQNLTSAQLNALLVLRNAGPEGMLMGEIGQKLVVTKSNVTGLVDRLERQGLVVRAEHRDRRATAVRLTEAGAAMIDRIAPSHAQLLADLTGCLDTEEKETLIRLLTKLRRQWRERRKEAP